LITTLTLLSVTASAASADIKPISGSIEWGEAGQVYSRSPPGTIFFHNFSNGSGRDVREVYRIEDDGNISLMMRSISNGD
jgi:hypothetical protein